MPFNKKKRCDVCIIGAGPAGLATLSAIHEPYSLDSMTNTQVNNAHLSMKGRHSGLGPSEKKICVIDPNETWLVGWGENFARLGIRFLRSPAMAHPDHFDMNSLLAYAVAKDRENELIESGCASIRKLDGLGQTQGLAVDLTRKNDAESGDVGYIVTLDDGREIETSSVVLALGPTGDSIVPPGLRGVPAGQLVSWTCMQEKMKPHQKDSWLLGGGLTAVQVAQSSLRQGRRVCIYSRRQLIERHFDIDTCWFDRRSANKHISDFYHQSEEVRLSALREVRGGGSVPPMYMEDLRKWKARGNLTLSHGNEPEYLGSTADGKVLISLGEQELEFDCIILACGIKPNCTSNYLVKKIQEKYPVTLVGGLPDVSVDLEWSENMFVVGALASLNVGPDAGNIMGARRAASIVANALECKTWLRDEEGRGALSNPFTQLFWDEDDSSSDSDSESD